MIIKEASEPQHTQLLTRVVKADILHITILNNIGHEENC